MVELMQGRGKGMRRWAGPIHGKRRESKREWEKEKERVGPCYLGCEMGFRFVFSFTLIQI